MKATVGNNYIKHLESVINSGLFSEIDKADYMSAFESLKISARSFAKNEMVFFEGDLIDKLCIVETGAVRGEKTYDNGEVHIIDVYDEGAVFAMDIASSRTKVSAIDFISNVETLVVFISMNSIDRSEWAEEMKTALTYKLADASIKMSHKIEILAERGLRDRVLVYLDILQRKAKRKTVTVRMNREQLAQYLCVNRSALSNELNKMRREGILEFKRNEFTVLRNVLEEKREQARQEAMARKLLEDQDDKGNTVIPEEEMTGESYTDSASDIVDRI